MKKLLLVLVLAAIVISIVLLEKQKVTPADSAGEASSVAVEAAEEKAKEYLPAVELVNPSGFVNSEPFQIGDYIGDKVILVDFWTYSCINCQRTTPYLNAWHTAYEDDGLLIVGVHTPEFDFEKEISNVRAAVEKFGIEYPVVQDNDYSTWTAYKNRYWPRKYLIDIDGYIVYDHIGEGGYEETEAKIQELLTERAQRLNQETGIYTGVLVEGMPIPEANSPETYFGSQRNDLLINGVSGQNGLQNFAAPGELVKNKLYLEGEWLFEDEYAQSQGPGKIHYRYDAKNVYMVASADEAVTVTIKVDGILVKTLTIQAEELYELVSHESAGEHLLEIDVQAAGLKIYTFTFG
ncbi:MAG: redoxin domain-containing protein [Patescibacteria group bacterium]